MSRDVEQRVVEMRFDNAQFERGISQSQASLDGLNKSLGELGGTRTGLSAFAATLKGISFAPINNGIHIGIGKLSALTAALTGVSNIADGLYNKVTGTIRALSGIDNVVAGFEKYNMATESVQTMMSATRKDGEDAAIAMERCNDAVEDLMWFADETSYSTQQMTDAIGKFASAGVDLDDAKNAIEGIALWAATAGINAKKASGAFYNISQSMSAGYMTSIDWKSLEILNFTTLKSRQAILDTAVAMGKLRKEGNRFFTELGTEVTTGNIRETLQEKWFDQELMTEVFKSYSAVVPKIKKMVDEGIVDTASEAIAMLKEEGLEAAEMFSLNALEMGQEAKTLQEALDSVTDAASSKFQQIFQTIFGNYLEAKELFTDLANGLYEVFIEPLNKMVEGFKQWKQEVGNGRTKALKSIYTIITSIYSVFSKFKELWEEQFGDKTTKTRKRLEAITFVLGKIANAVGKLCDEIIENETIIDNISAYFEGLKNIMTAVKDVFKGLFEEIAKRMGSSGGASKLLEWISSIFGWIGKLLTRIAELINDSNIVSKAFEAFDKVSGKLKRTFEILGKVFKNIFHFDKDRNIIWQLGNAAIEFKSPLENIVTILSVIADLAKDVIVQISPMVSTVWAFIKSVIGFLAKLLENFAPIIRLGIQTLTQGITAATETMTEYFNNAEFTNPFEVIGNIIKKIAEGIGKFINFIIDGVIKVRNATADNGERKTFLDRLGEGIANFAETLYGHKEAIEWMQRTLFGNKDMLTVLFSIAKNLVDLFTHVAASVLILYGITKLFNLLCAIWADGKGGGLIGKATGIMHGLKSIYTSFMNIMGKFANASMIKSFAFLIASFAGSIFLLSMIPARDLVTAMIVLSVGIVLLGGIVKMLIKIFKDFEDSLKFDTLNEANVLGQGKHDSAIWQLAVLIGSIGAACLMMASAISAIATLANWDSALVGFAGLTIIITAVTGMLFAISKMGFTQEDLGVLGMIGVLFVAIGKTAQWMAKGVTSMAEVGDQDAITSAVGALMIMLSGILAIALFAAGMKNADEGALKGMARLLFTAGIMFVGIAVAVKIMSKMTDLVEVMPAIIMLTTIVSIIMIAITLMAKAVENIGSGTQVAALAMIGVIVMTMTGAIVALAIAIISIATIVGDSDKIWAASAAILAILAMMGLLMTFASIAIGKDGGANLKTMVAFAAGFALMGLAILAFVPALWALSKIDFGALMAGVLVIGILLGLFVGISALAGNFPVMAKGMQVFTTALLGLSIAMALSSASFLIIAFALDIIVNAFAKLVAIGPAAADQIRSIAKALGEGIVEIFKGVANGFIELFKIFIDNKTTIFKYAGTMIGVFISALTANLPALFEYIKQVFQGVLDLLWTFGPGILEFVLDQTEQLIDKLLDIIINVGPKLNKAVTLLVKTALLEILKALEEIIPQIVETLFVALIDSVTRITTAIAEFEDVLFDALNTLADALIVDLPVIVGKFSAIGVTMIVGWIGGMIVGLMKSIPEFVDKASTAFVEMVDQLADVLERQVGPVYNALKQLIISALEAVGEWCGRFYADTNGNGFKMIKKICAYITEGFNKGFNDQKNRNKIAAGIKTNITDVAIGTATSEFGIQSPSKVFQMIGQYVSQGFSNGVESGLPGVKSSALDLASTFSNSFSNAFGDTGNKFKTFGKHLTDRLKSRIGGNGNLFAGLFNTDSMSSSLGGMFDGMNLNPTITPTLDLSQIETGVSDMDDMLTTNSNIKAIADINDWSANENMQANMANYESALDTKSQMNDFMGMFGKYLDIQQYNAEQPTNVNVTLEGDAGKMLKVLRVEDLKQAKASGTQFFNRASDFKGNINLSNVFSKIHK